MKAQAILQKQAARQREFSHTAKLILKVASLQSAQTATASVATRSTQPAEYSI